MKYRVVFSEKAVEQLGALFDYIANAVAPEIAARFTESIVAYCKTLQDFPHRGTARDDVRPGLRITNYKKRTIIAFAVDVDAKEVAVLGLFYGGQNYEAILQDNTENSDND